MRKYDYVKTKEGKIEKKRKDLKKLLNLNYAEYTNKTVLAGRYDFPALYCDTLVLPDYLAAYDCPGEYNKTKRTCVTFQKYDNIIDGYDSLYNAIYHNITDLLEYYKRRFTGVKMFFSPDYSLLGDMDKVEVLYRIKKMRVVSLWLTLEMGAVVIPVVTFPTVDSLDWCLDGLEDCRVVAFYTMGQITNKHEYRALKKAVEYTVDRLDLRAIVVFDTCETNKIVNDVFMYPMSKGIKVVVPDNALKHSHMERRKKKERATDEKF